MKKTPSILILSYTFPPQGGVGGRRWAKLAKALKKKGIEVEVLAANLEKSAESPWKDDVSGIRVTRFPTRFPEILTRYPKSMRDKLRYRVALRRMRRKTKGTPYDRAALDASRISGILADKMRTFRPDVVIATGAPFDLLYFVSDQIELFPDVKFMADLRDPWINGRAFGYSELSNSRLNRERKKESAVVKRFHLITMPWEKNIEELADRHPDQSTKMHVLPHFYDQDDLDTDVEIKGPHLIYGGALYENLDPVLRQLAQFSERNKIFTEIYTADKDKSALSNPYFKVSDSLPVKEFLAKAARSRFLLLFLPEGNRHGLTKLIEYAACHRPILAIGKKSDLSHEIEKLGLGKHIDEANLEEDLSAAINDPSFFHPDQEWIDHYSLENISERLIKLLELED